MAAAAPGDAVGANTDRSGGDRSGGDGGDGNGAAGDGGRAGATLGGLSLRGFDHVHLYVGNAVQAAAYYVTRFGFTPLAYRGLETGARDVTTHVLRQGRILLALSSIAGPAADGDSAVGAGDDTARKDIVHFVAAHGDGVRDVAFEVEDARAAFDFAVSRGAEPVSAPQVLRDDGGEGDGGSGHVVLATVHSGYGDTVHSFVERRAYTGGTFMPGFGPPREGAEDDPLLTALPAPQLAAIDHCVSNQPAGHMEPVVRAYEQCFGMHRFWSVDDARLHTEFSALRSVVVTDADERVKMPVNEPAPGKGKSQIEEFVEYHGGAGIQHVALHTEDIVAAVAALRARGVAFVRIPDAYYDTLAQQLHASGAQLRERLEDIRRLGILVDSDDEGGYLLQTFTRPVGDRPTLFIEIIQRRRNAGFGIGNFKALFEAIEREQAERGNL